MLEAKVKEAYNRGEEVKFFCGGFDRYGTPLEALEQRKDLIRVISFLVGYVQIML